MHTTVVIKNGEVQGKVMSDRYGNRFVAFVSIPYAKPPIGNLRFKAPLPAENWEGVLQALREIPVSIQDSKHGMVGSEDCLYLNVYTPEESKNIQARSLKPVMVFIHGGAFNQSSSSIRKRGPLYFMTARIVLVTINYRLGALGFLSSDDTSAGFSSNNGLKDQVLALKWVQENILQFGGNPDKVTIFGESAGAVCVHMLVLSPMAKGLFHGAIMQSGSAITPWAIGQRNTIEAFVKSLGLQTTNPAYLLQRLQRIPAKRIFKTQQRLGFYPKFFEKPMGSPCVEDPNEKSFLPYHPRAIIKSGIFNKVPMIMGYNNSEGIMFDLSLKLTDQQFVYNGYDYIPHYFDQNKLDEINDRLLNHYTNGSVPTESKDMIPLWTDASFKYDTVKSALDHAEVGHNDVFLYEFSMDTSLNHLKRKHPALAIYEGAAHADELGYLFSRQNTPDIMPDSIEEISVDRMIRLWTNFAKYKNPTPIEDELFNNQIWLPIKTKEINYMSLGCRIACKEYNDDGFNFWQNLYEEYDTFNEEIL